MYNYDKQAVSTLGYQALQLEQQKQQQLKVQQQQQQRQKKLAEQLKQKQQEMQQQLQRRTHAMQMQKLRQQQQTFQREMVDKQRQQREAFELANMNDYNQQGLIEPQFKPWRYPANQNPQDKFQSSGRVHSKPVSPRSGATLSTFYPEISQKLYERYPTYRTIPTNYKGNSVATGELNQQQINPVIKTYSVNSLKRSDLSTSSENDIEVLERSRTRVTENVPPSLSQTVISPTWRRSGLNRVLQNSDQNFTNLSLQPVKDNHENVYSLTANEIASLGVIVKPTSRSQESIQLQTGSPLNAHDGLVLNGVLQNSDTNFTNLTLQPVKHNHGNVYSLSANEITSTEVDVKPTSQSQDSILLQKGNPPHAPPNKEATPLPLQKAEGQIQQFSVKPAIYMFQTKTEGTPSMQSKSTLNVTSQVEKRGDVDDKTASQPQKKSARKEKLFYFPIKRDTLISLLPMHLQEKYRSLRDTRNVNSSYEASISKNKVNSTVKMEDIKLQNLSQKVDPPTIISSYNYSVQQIKTGNDSITEYFYLPSQTTAEIINSTSVNSSVNEEDLEKASIESKNGTIAPS